LLPCVKAIRPLLKKDRYSGATNPISLRSAFCAPGKNFEKAKILWRGYEKIVFMAHVVKTNSDLAEKPRDDPNYLKVCIIDNGVRTSAP